MNRKYSLLALAIGLMLPFVSGAQVAPLAAVTTSPASTAAPLLCFDFNQNLKSGSKGEAVRMLQYFLITGEQATIDSGEYGVFGQTTMSAIVAFQQKYAQDVLAHVPHQQPTGNVGPATKAKLKALYGCQIAVNAPVAAALPTSVKLAVTNVTLDSTGVTAVFCNQGSVNLPTAPFRIRLNGINRDFEIIGAQTAGACDTESFPYATWGLSYDPSTTFTAITLIDPNSYYKKSVVQYPLNGNAVLTASAITGAHLSVRSAVVKTNGVQATFCNLGTVNLTSFPVRVTVNGTPKDFDIATGYKTGTCVPVTWNYSNWGLAYVPGTVYTVTIQVDPNNAIQETNEFDNSATVVGMP